MLKQHPCFEGVQWESVFDQDAPVFVLPPPPDDEAESFDWDLSTLASLGPIKYEYVPTGTPGLESQHSAASSSSASSRGSSPVRAVGHRGSACRQPVGAVSRLSSVSAALDASSLDSLQQEISHLGLAQSSSSAACEAVATGQPAV